MTTKLERWIDVCKIGTYEATFEINVDIIPFEKLLEIVVPRKDDPLLYEGYILNENQLRSIQTLLKQHISIDLKTFTYTLVCASV